jgi:thiol-disulfide isomerase/thioredoxin
MKPSFTLLAATALTILFVSPTPAQNPSPTPAQSGTAQPIPDLSQFHSADDLWAHIQKIQQGPPPSSTPREVMALLRHLTAAATEFQTRYPKDPRRWDAKLIFLQYDSMLASAESRDIDPDKMESDLNAVANAPDASASAKAQARVNLIQLHAQASGQETLTPDVEKEILAFIHDFPTEPVDAELQKMRLESLQKTDPAKSAALIDALLKDPNPAVVEFAQSQVAGRDLMKKPLDLQFTATDGSKVDLKQLRGKVVLIDFWASWCAPCMERIPDIVTLYKHLHGKGLEIIGISLDQDKSLVKAVTLSNGMVWPEYFDGKGWQNDISSRYGITSIPRMFLLDKKGMVVDPDVQDGLEDKVGKLVTQ